MRHIEARDLVRERENVGDWGKRLNIEMLQYLNVGVTAAISASSSATRHAALINYIYQLGKNKGH